LQTLLNVKRTIQNIYIVDANNQHGGKP